MKYLLSFLLFFSPFTSFCQTTRVESDVGVQDEIEILQELIATTQKNLTNQKKILKLVVTFKQARAAFMAEPTSGPLATKLVKSAMALQKGLDKEHLYHLFSSDFLTELSFFNQIGNQQIIARD